MSRAFFCITALAISFASSAFAAAPGDAKVQVKQLVQSFLEAERNYDVPALAPLISDRYVEVSPAGEVDEHDRFLGFYAPEKKDVPPPVVVSEEQIRVFGDTAVEILKFTYTMPAPGGGTRNLEMRGSFIARHEGKTWKLISAQFTGIRPAPARK
jgi:ketosteroid isomerase-like protein